MSSTSILVPLHQASSHFVTVVNTGHGSFIRDFVDDFAFAKTPGWCGPSSEALTNDVIDFADRITSSLPGSRYVVEVTPGRDGSLSIIWDDHAGNYVYLDVGPKRTIHLYYDVLGQPKWEGVSIDGDPTISFHLGLAFQFAAFATYSAPIARTSTSNVFRYAA
jgi:hypothetical protein